MAKQEPSIVIDKLGTHLLRVTNNHTGQVDLKWDWDKLLEEVQAVTSGAPAKVRAESKKKPAAKKDLVKETETKVTKTRAKKVVNDQITDAVTTKKPAAKKPAAKKKPVAKKKPAAKKSS